MIGRWHFTQLRLARRRSTWCGLKDGGLNDARVDTAAGRRGPKKAKGKAARGKASAQGRAGGAASLCSQPWLPPTGGAAPAGHPADGKAAVDAAATPTGPDFLLALTRIRDGVLRFGDRSLAEALPRAHRAINLDMRDLATEGELLPAESASTTSAMPAKFTTRTCCAWRLRVLRAACGLIRSACPLPPYLATAMPGASIGGGSLSGGAQYRVTLGKDGARRR